MHTANVEACPDGLAAVSMAFQMTACCLSSLLGFIYLPGHVGKLAVTWS